MNKYTWNNFKTQVKGMKENEQRDLLKELQAELMYSKTRRFQNPNTMRVSFIKKQIAYVKTVMGN